MATKVREKFGTPVLYVGSLSALSDGSFVHPFTTIYTHSANTSYVRFVLDLSYVTAPNDNGAFRLYARPTNLPSGDSYPLPTSTYPGIPIGVAYVKGVTGSQRLVVTVKLPGHTKASATYSFAFINNTGQTISSGYDVWVIPVTLGPL